MVVPEGPEWQPVASRRPVAIVSYASHILLHEHGFQLGLYHSTVGLLLRPRVNSQKQVPLAFFVWMYKFRSNFIDRTFDGDPDFIWPKYTSKQFGKRQSSRSNVFRRYQGEKWPWGRKIELEAVYVWELTMAV